VGNSGFIATSPDGVGWTVRDNKGVKDSLQSNVWTGERLFTVGTNEILLGSWDGVNWE